MEEKELKKATNQENIKLEWEAPKLFCLDKGKTESGSSFQKQAEESEYEFS